MKRFELWLTMIIVFSLPAMVSAQGTSGSPGIKIKRQEGGATKVTGGKKGAAHPQLARMGTSKPPKTTGNGIAPALESQPRSPAGGAGSAGAGKTIEAGTGRKGIKGIKGPTTSAGKKPPRPAQAKPPDQE